MPDKCLSQQSARETINIQTEAIETVDGPAGSRVEDVRVHPAVPRFDLRERHQNLSGGRAKTEPEVADQIGERERTGEAVRGVWGDYID